MRPVHLAAAETDPGWTSDLLVVQTMYRSAVQVHVWCSPYPTYGIFSISKMVAGYRTSPGNPVATTGIYIVHACGLCTCAFVWISELTDQNGRKWRQVWFQRKPCMKHVELFDQVTCADQTVYRRSLLFYIIYGNCEGQISQYESDNSLALPAQTPSGHCRERERRGTGRERNRERRTETETDR